jgi:hypothetical protein
LILDRSGCFGFKFSKFRRENGDLFDIPFGGEFCYFLSATFEYFHDTRSIIFPETGGVGAGLSVVEDVARVALAVAINFVPSKSQILPGDKMAILAPKWIEPNVAGIADVFISGSDVLGEDGI